MPVEPPETAYDLLPSPVQRCVLGVLAALLALALLGCGGNQDAWLETWAQPGAGMPDDFELGLLQNHPRQARILREGICHGNPAVRLRAAYAIARLDNAAKGLTADLRKAYDTEATEEIRYEIVFGLAAARDDSEENVAFLRRAFGSEASQRIKSALAGALLCISPREDEQAAWTWLEESVRAGAPDHGADEQTVKAHWHRRLAASRAIALMGHRGAELHPALAKLREHPETPEWVREQLARDAKQAR